MKIALTIALVSAFGLVAVFGVAAMSHGAETGMDTGMSGHCPFAPGSSAVCPMDALLHMEHWQGIFMATQIFWVFTLLIGLVVFVAFVRRSTVPKTLIGAGFRERLEGDVRAAADFLKLAFSAGILHPRVYA